MNIWATSDEHYGHGEICRLSGRPFSCVDEMNEALIQNHNERVKMVDTVFHIGDFSFLNEEKSKAILGRLNGKHHTVLGNHDRSAAWMLRLGFMSAQHATALTIGGRHIFMRHLPIMYTREGGGDEARKFSASFYKEPSNVPNLFLCGHVHEKWKVRANCINVGVDQWSFSPVNMDELLALAAMF